MVPARNCNVRVVTTVPTLRRARLVPQCNEASSPSTFIVHSCKLFLCWFLLMHKSCCDVSPPLAGRLYCVCGCVRAVVDVAVLPHPGTPPALQLGAAGLRGNKVLLSPPAPSQRFPFSSDGTRVLCHPQVLQARAALPLTERYPKLQPGAVRPMGGLQQWPQQLALTAPGAPRLSAPHPATRAP